MIKIYTSLQSPFGNASLICASALNVDFARIIYDPEDPKQQAEFDAHSLSQKVPLLIDGDVAVFEHIAINKYLTQRQGSPFYPKDIKKQAVVDQWTLFISNHVFLEGIRPVFRSQYVPSKTGGTINPTQVAYAIHSFDRYFKVIDEQLKKTGKFVVGDQLTIADFSLLGLTDVCELLKVPYSYPHFESWREGLKSQEFYKRLFPTYQYIDLFEVYGLL